MQSVCLHLHMQVIQVGDYDIYVTYKHCLKQNHTRTCAQTCMFWLTMGHLQCTTSTSLAVVQQSIGIAIVIGMPVKRPKTCLAWTTVYVVVTVCYIYYWLHVNRKTCLDVHGYTVYHGLKTRHANFASNSSPPNRLGCCVISDMNKSNSIPTSWGICQQLRGRLPLVE